MPRSGVNGTYTLPGAQNGATPLQPISSAVNNQGWNDVAQTFNTPTPEAYGGTGASTFAQARDNLGLEIGVDIPSNALMNANARPSLIVNGNFQMSQENGTTLGTANNFYFADQFFLSYTAATAAMSVQLLTSIRTLSGNDRVGEFKTTTAKASLGATDFVTLSTVIEGSRPEWKAAAFGTAGAKPFVYRFEFTGPAGLYHMHFQNSAGNRHCAVPFTVQPGEANVAVVRTIIVPPDTTGTWPVADGDKGLVADLVLAAGATLTGGTASTWGATARLAATTQFNILSSTSNVARIADVGLKNDPDATGVYGLFNLMEQNPVYRSERYFFKTFPPAISPQNSAGLSGALIATSYASGGIGARLQYPVQMAKLPAVSTYNPIANNASWRDITNATDRAIAANQAASVLGIDLLAATSGPSAAFNYIHATANARL